MKTVIAGLEEGLQSIAEALEGGGGGGGEGAVVPTPTLNDESKVLKAVPQSQTKVAPEWATIREVPIDGQNGQVLTKNSDGYGWAAPSGGLPSIDSSDSGKVLYAWYDSEEDHGYSQWVKAPTVPSSNASDAGKVLTCSGRNAYGWAPASSGGHIDVVKFDIAKSSFTQDEQVYTTAFASDEYDILRKINNMISLTIVDTSDIGYPDVINPATGECSISYSADLVNITISATVYAALGTRDDSHFYMTYYNAE